PHSPWIFVKSAIFIRTLLYFYCFYRSLLCFPTRRSSDLIYIILRDAVNTCIDPSFRYVKFTIVIGITGWTCDCSNHWISYQYIAQAHVAFVCYRESVADGLIDIGTFVSVLVIKDSSFHDCNGRVLAKLDYRWIVFKYTTFVRKITYRALVRRSAYCSGLVCNLTGIYIILSNSVGTSIDPSFSYIKFTIVIGITGWTCDCSNHWISYQYIAQAHVAFVCYRESVADGLIDIGTFVSVLVIKDSSFHDCN